MVRLTSNISHWKVPKPFKERETKFMIQILITIFLNRYGSEVDSIHKWFID